MYIFTGEFADFLDIFKKEVSKSYVQRVISLKGSNLGYIFLHEPFCLELLILYRMFCLRKLTLTAVLEIGH